MSGSRHVPVVGLVGGVGSGKSTLARAIASRRPVAVIDGDAIGHEVLREPQIREQIRRRFGAEVFGADGEVVRGAVARLVFGEGEVQRRARHDLERIVQPRIRQRIAERINELQSDPTCAAVLLDAAVLLEAGWNDLCDRIVYIDTPEHLRNQRVQQTRGWSSAQLAGREASQWSLERKRQAADHIISNDGPVEDALRQLEAVLDEAAAKRGGAPGGIEQIHDR